MTQTTREAVPQDKAALHSDPGWQAFALLRTVFTIAPIAFGLDKFFNLLTDWPDYLAPIVTDVVPVTAQQFMYAVGVIEIVAGLCVFFLPRFGSLLVAAWLGLFVAALALFRLSVVYAPRVLAKRA